MGLEFKNAGVVSGGDMTVEACTTKLAYLFGSHEDYHLERVRAFSSGNDVPEQRTRGLSTASLESLGNSCDTAVALVEQMMAATGSEVDSIADGVRSVCTADDAAAAARAQELSDNIGSPGIVKTVVRLHNLEWMEEMLVSCIRGEVTTSDRSKYKNVRRKIFDDNY